MVELRVGQDVVINRRWDCTVVSANRVRVNGEYKCERGVWDTWYRVPTRYMAVTDEMAVREAK